MTTQEAMKLEIQLPALPGGAARVLRWLAAEGDAVDRGAPLAVVLTDRAEVLLPAPAAGVLAERAAEGAAVEPGGLMGRIAPAADEAPAPEPTADPASALQAAPPPHVRATPLARNIAEAHAVELLGVAGSGPGGCVMAADVRALISPAAGVSLAPPPIPSAPVNSRPAAAPLAPSAAVDDRRPAIPIATATVELDASAALARVTAMDRQLAPLRLRLSLGACVVEAVAALLPAHPPLNARWGDEAIVLRRRVHVAVAEPGETGGLRWAVVCDAGDLTLRGVARALRAAAQPDLAAATFAVISLAPGAGWHTAVPPLPWTAAALSVGAPVRRAVATDAGVAVRPVAALTLSYDARVADHGCAAAFLNAVKASLERGA